MQQTVYEPSKHFYIAPKEFDDAGDGASDMDSVRESSDVKIELAGAPLDDARKSVASEIDPQGKM